MKETFVLGEEDLYNLAEKVAGTLASKERSRAAVLFLEGDLGAGKTTFTKALAEHLGIDKESVHSPTFILKKEYGARHPHFKKLVHIDAYRFTHPDEARVLRLEEDLKDPHTIVAIEWPSKMSHLASDATLSFEVEDETIRHITLTY